MTQNFYYQEEKKYARSRLGFLLILAVLGFVFFERTSNMMISNMSHIILLLVEILVISFMHYAFLLKYPKILQRTRKVFLVFMDLLVLTLLVAMLKEYGLYFLPLYVWIVMWSGSSFGMGYFYISIITIIPAWIGLLAYTDYWYEHYDILISFSITTFLIPLFFLKYMVKVHEKNSELTQVLTSTKHDANFDVLTGIANRKMYKTRMKKIISRKEFFALLFIDLNKFKVINDTYGHNVGDEVLKEVTKRLSATLDPNDFIARLGGDEFVIVTKRKKIFLEKFLQKIVKDVIGDFTTRGVTVLIELSIGVSSYPDDSQLEMTLTKYADEAMYEAKKAPNTYYMFYENLSSE